MIKKWEGKKERNHKSKKGEERNAEIGEEGRTTPSREKTRS